VTKPWRVHEEAEQELEAAGLWYEARKKGLGLAFYDAIRRAREHAEAFPLAGSPLGGEARRVLVEGFPYALVYAEFESHWEVVAVAHVRQKPGFWRGRVRG
jgi:toxin ParE1/3/4